MTVQLNHTIVGARDKWVAAAFFSEILGLPKPVTFGPFVGVVANDVTFDFADWGADIQTQHYAFLVEEDEFDEIFGRIKARDLPYWADPHQHQKGEINTHDGGRGVYFDDASGHLLEIITRPYGSGR